MAINHTHIVPRAYLRQFANNDDRIAMVLVESGEERLPTTRDAAVRSGIYKRVRPDGSRSDDIETHSIQSIETDAAPLLKDVIGAWPFSSDDKLAMALFLGLQLVRVPRWMNWHNDFWRAGIEDWRREGMFEPRPDQLPATEEEIYQANVAHFLGSTNRLVRMLQLAAKAASALGSMCWGLVEFPQPLLATSDHPVVAWPSTTVGREPEAAVPGTTGLLNFLEVRVPLTPSLALLMSWRDMPDDPVPLVGKRHHAENLNAFTVAEAEKQWFYLPGSRPRYSSGKWLPLSPELYPGYTPARAARGHLRSLASADLQARMGDDSRKAEINYLPQP